MRFDLYLNQFLAMALSEKKIHLNSDGSAWRPNLYIGDVPEVIESCLELDNQSSTIINIGNHKSNFQIIDVVKKIKKYTQTWTLNSLRKIIQVCIPIIM